MSNKETVVKFETKEQKEKRIRAEEAIKRAIERAKKRNW